MYTQKFTIIWESHRMNENLLQYFNHDFNMFRQPPFIKSIVSWGGGTLECHCFLLCSNINWWIAAVNQLRCFMKYCYNVLILFCLIDWLKILFNLCSTLSKILFSVAEPLIHHLHTFILLYIQYIHIPFIDKIIKILYLSYITVSGMLQAITPHSPVVKSATTIFTATATAKCTSLNVPGWAQHKTPSGHHRNTQTLW